MLTHLFSLSSNYFTPAIGLSILSLLLAAILVLVIYVHLQERTHQATIPNGFQKLGRTKRSNLHDEHDSKYTSGHEQIRDSKGRPSWKIKALYIFPIKSCAALELDEADVCPIGLAWDREFSFAELITPETRPDAPEESKQPTWRFRTQRTPGYENLALVVPELWFTNGPAGAAPGEDTNGVMIVRYPHIFKGPLKSAFSVMQIFGLLPRQRSFTVPLDPPEPGVHPSKGVIIWKDTPKWFDYAQYVPDDLADFVGAENPFTLFRADPERYRKVTRCAPRKEQLGYQSVIGFQDAYPLHLLNLASVRNVAAKVEYALPVFTARRFRANFITEGPAPYDEDDWKKIRIGDGEYYCACHTVRCKLPNVDPDTAIRHRFEPDKALKSFRRIDAGDPTNACLGLQLVPASQRGKIRIGDEIEVMGRGEHFYLKQ